MAVSDKSLANLRRFPKGTSGNPSGKTPGSTVLAKMLAKETDGGKEVIAFVLGVMRGFTEEPKVGRSRKVRVKRWTETSRRWAADWVGDRLWGRAKQVIEIDTGGPQASVNYDALSDADLAELDRLMTKAMEGVRAEDPTVSLPPGDAIPIEATEDADRDA